MSYYDASIKHLYEEYNLSFGDTYTPSDLSSYEPCRRRESFPADRYVDVTMRQEEFFSGRGGMMDYGLAHLYSLLKIMFFTIKVLWLLYC